LYLLASFFCFLILLYLYAAQTLCDDINSYAQLLSHCKLLLVAVRLGEGEDTGPNLVFPINRADGLACFLEKK
jgi:hypothetical protein